MRRETKPANAKGKASFPAARKSLKSEGSRVRDLEKRLAQALKREVEALEQQTATAEILRVISTSPTDEQPVFEVIVRSAARLCHGANAAVFRTDGQVITHPANYGASPDAYAEVVRQHYPMPLTRRTHQGQAMLERSIVYLEDAEAPSTPSLLREAARRLGFRSQVTIPMLRDDQPVGAITVTRPQPGRFTDAEVALLQTFADQAVIAIENVRLFQELEGKNRELTDAHTRVTETLERQTATAEILRVISGSPMDVQPVFDTIVHSAVRLLDGHTALVLRVGAGQLHLAAMTSTVEVADEAVSANFPVPISDSGLASHVARRGCPYVVTDTETDPMVTERIRRSAPLRGYRSMLLVPMVREGQVIGVLTVTRRAPGGFGDKEVELLKTFADQAVIAIENVRLFQELETRTGELSRSVEELKALAEVSQALSSTLDVETVLATIVARAIELAGAAGGSVYEYDDATAEFRLRATQNFEEEVVAAARAMRVRPGEGALGMVAERRQPIQIADISDPAVYQSAVREILLRTGYRAILALPLLRDNRLVGALVIGRKSPGLFPPGVIELLTTFANQSTLAIQNAHLFREIAEKSRELEAASRHKSEFLANMSHELRTPLNAIIGFSEVLSERMFGELNDKQAEYLKDIYASGQHLLSLINDILDLSKIEAGRMELELTEFDLPSAVENALILVRERASRRGITLGRTIDARLGTLQGDERKVKQVLLNLLSNALKFTPEGGRIDVSARVQDGAAEIAVTDTGVGIAPEDQEAVFEEFRQVGTADKKVEGTGLGLALSRKFIELHGGRIWVESEVGHGSTFTFTLPVRRED